VPSEKNKKISREGQAREKQGIREAKYSVSKFCDFCPVIINGRSIHDCCPRTHNL